MNIYTKIKLSNKLIILLLILGLSVSSIYSEDITGKISSFSNSTSVDFFNPPEFMTDNDSSTNCRFNQQTETGWIEIQLNDEYELHGLELQGISSGSDLQFKIEYFDKNGWIPFTLSKTTGSEIFDSYIDLSYDRKVSDRIRLSFLDQNLADTELISMKISGKQPGDILSKIHVARVDSSHNTSHFYSAEYLIDQNARTQWAAYPHLFKKFPDKFQNRDLQKLDDVSKELNSLRDMNALTRSFYSFFTYLEAELILENPGEIEYINLYFTDESEGDFALSVFSEGQWFEIHQLYDTENLESGWIRVDVDSSIISVEKIKVYFEGDKIRLGGLSEVEIWGKRGFKGNSVVNLPVSSGNTLENPAVFGFVLEKKSGYFINLELDNYNEQSFSFDINGRDYETVRQTGRSGNTLYSTELNIDHI